MLKSIRKTLSYRYWWFYLIVGIITIIIGFFCLIIPCPKFKELTYLCVGSFFVQSICNILFPLLNKMIIMGWWWQIAKGVMVALVSFFIIDLSINGQNSEAFDFIGYLFLASYICSLAELFDLRSKNPNGLIVILGLSLVGVILSFCFLYFNIHYNGVIFFFLLLLCGFMKIIFGVQFFYWNKELIETTK